MQVGERVFIGMGCHLDPAFCFLISIGDRTTLSLNVTVLAHDGSTRRIVGYTRLAPVHIGSDVFVGADSTILPGVTIGDGAIIGAGSVVRHDVPPGVMVAGNPATPIGDRDAYAARHEAALAHKPCWERTGWTATTGITRQRIDEVRRGIAEHGEGYIR